MEAMTDEGSEDYVPHVVLAHKAEQVSARNQQTGEVVTFPGYCFVSTWNRIRDGKWETDAVTLRWLAPGTTFYTGKQ